MGDAEQQIGSPGYYDHDQTDLLKLVTVPVSSILEIGCAGGNMLRHYLDEGVARVTGVEYVDSVAEEARKRCPEATILSGDIDVLPLDQLGNGYDLLIASFVLEHVADPWKTLGRLCTLLRPGGQLIGALPNVRHLSVTLPLLLRGRWDYVDEGIMDRTHYRFFTRATIVELLTDTGFSKVQIDPWVNGGMSSIGDRLTMGFARDHFAFAYRFSAYRDPHP